MATQDPASRVQQDVSSFQNDLRSLQSSVRLSSLRDSVEDLGSNVAGLKQRVAELRARGYAFEKTLEARAADMLQQWTALRPSIQAQIEQQAATLMQALPPLERQMQELAVQSGDLLFAQSRVAQVKSAIEILKGRVSGVESSIRGAYDGIQSQYSQLASRLSQIDWMLKQISEATFSLLPVEAGINAVRATWIQGEKRTGQDPQGVLYLTDQRLVFEQKQEIATKKVLFITTEKQKVQKLLLEVPVGRVEKVTASDTGFMGHEDHVYVDLAPEAVVRRAHFHIDGQDCKEWAGLIGRAKSGDWDQDRAVAVDPSVVERARTAPTRCPTCGGALQAVVRGMDHIQCEYCGSIVRF